MLMAQGVARAKRAAGWAGKVALFALIVVTVLIAATPQGRTSASAVMFAMQLLPAVPIKPLAWFTPEPERKRITFDGSSGRLEADLYVPGGEGPFGGTLLFLGVNPAGRDDERVVNLAGGLARTGRVVMVPWSEHMVAKRIETSEAPDLVSAFEYLSALDNVDPNRVGMAGFCVGASIAAVAAQDPLIAHRVAYVNFFGGYLDAAEMVVSVASNTRSYSGLVEPWETATLSVEVIRIHLIDDIASAEERDVLERAFLKGEPITSGELESLSDEAATVFAMLSGPTRSEAQQLLANLPAETRSSLREISPISGLDRLSARLLIMHDREDALIPYSESKKLLDALGDGGNAYYTEFSFFSHVDPTEPVGVTGFISEGFKLFLHLYNVLRTA